ncbi:NACHT, LRR and PYD domains-containing protein 14, partial [Lunasporangiospora selenospora]
ALSQPDEDIEFHTQLQLHAYLDDIERVEVAAELQAHREVAVHYATDSLDPLQDWSASYANTRSLRTTAAATATADAHGGASWTGTSGASASTTASATGAASPPALVVTNAAISTSAAEVTANAFQHLIEAGPHGLRALVGSGAHLSNGLGPIEEVEARNHLDQDDDMDEYGFEYEECPPPSEVKYILYDDRVSPINVTKALAILNGNMHEDLWDELDHSRGISSVANATAFVATGGYARDYHWTQQTASPSTGLVSPKAQSPVSHFSDLAERDMSDDEAEGDSLLRPFYQGGPDISLNLASNGLSPDNLHEIFFSRFYTRLVHLNLWDTNLGVWGTQAVGGLMADRNCRIQYLNLGRNRLDFEGITQLLGMYKNHSLVELDLSENKLGPKGVHALQQIMVRLAKDRPCNIRRLNISSNEINDIGCVSIAKIIQGTVLTHIDLSRNIITDWGASTILAAFEANSPYLQDINMDANPLTFAGGVDMCKILVLPQSRVTRLDLRGAKVTDVGVPYLAEALKSHSCPIVTLNLYDCQLTDAGVLKLAVKLSTIIMAMRSNTSLLDLRIDSEPPSHRASSNAARGGFFAGLDGDNEQQYYSYPEQNHSSSILSSQRYQSPHLSYASQSNMDLGAAQSQAPPTLENVIANPITYMPPAAAQVGEVLAPTHAALTQPLQIPAMPLSHSGAAGQPSSGGNGASGSSGGSSSQSMSTGYMVQSGGAIVTHGAAAVPTIHFLNGGAGGGDEEEEERDLEWEQKQVVQLVKTLRNYIRLNLGRTNKLRILSFEILVKARVLMFAEDASPSMATVTTMMTQHLSLSRPASTGVDLEDSAFEICHGGNSNMRAQTQAIIPPRTGLPTPPLSTPEISLDQKIGLAPLPSEVEGRRSVSDDGLQEKRPGSTESWMRQECRQFLRHPFRVRAGGVGGGGGSGSGFSNERGGGPRGTMSGLPWEIKEMILRELDPSRLLSDSQFQAIMTHAASTWSTVRQPWERWGEIREGILEEVGCYYYES